MLTTPPPILDVLKDFPELAPLARTTVRLHPRRAIDGDVDASKLGGAFLWPVDEPWPVYDESRVNRFVQELLGNPAMVQFFRDEGRTDDVGRIPAGTSIPFAPILQLRAADFPEMPFPAGADLFQLLWFPYLPEFPPDGKSLGSSLDHRVFWRDSATIGARRASNPAMVKRHQGSFASPCRLHPERVVEYPGYQDLDPKLERRIDRWKAVRKIDHAGDSPIDFYQWECSVCPSTKVDGHVCWDQDKKVPTCSCGRPMAHLLTVADGEWDCGTSRRWQPLEEQGKDYGVDRDKIGSPPDLGNFVSFHLFVCTDCPGYPTRAVSER